MKILIMFFCLVFPFGLMASDYRILDKDYKIVGHIKGDKVYDKDWQTKYHIKGDKVYDKDWHKVGTLGDDQWLSK